MMGGRLRVCNRSSRITDAQLRHLVGAAFAETQLTGTGLLVIAEDKRGRASGPHTTYYAGHTCPTHLERLRPPKTPYVINVRIGRTVRVDGDEDVVLEHLASCAKAIQDIYDGVDPSRQRMNSYAAAIIARFRAERLRREHEREKRLSHEVPRSRPSGLASSNVAQPG